MKKQFVTYKIALKLKELGFDELCMAIYFREEFRFIGINSLKETNSQTNNIDIVDAPLWQQVIDWIREKHELHIVIYLLENDNFNFVIDALKYTLIEGGICNESYNIVKEQAILKALTLIK